MRRHLMLSTAAMGLMLASGWAYAQAPSSERKDEPKRTEEPAKGGAQHGQGAAQERAHGAQERMQNEHAQGAGREEKGGERHQATEEKNAPSTAAEHNRSKTNEQTQKEESSHERNRAAEGAKQGHEGGKSSAETKPESSGAQKSTAETEKSKSGAGQQNERSGTAANQNEHGQNQPSRNSAEKQTPAQQDNRPATATDTNRTPSNNNARNAPSATGAQTNQASRTNNTEINQQSRVSSEKNVRISETFSHEHLAAPERDLNIAIRVGEAVPQRVHLYRLPPDVVSIEPEYRDYEYFSTDDDIVIVEPGTHRIVSEVPRDPSRARAQLSGGSMGAAGGASMATAGGAGGGNVNCKIMRRDASGNVTEVQPSTVGSNARSDSLSVTVQLPGGGSSAPVPLGASSGDIVVATQGQGDCTVTLEPQTR